MDKKEILKAINNYDNDEVGVLDVYSKAERGIENELVSFQDESMRLGFVSAMKLIRDTPLGEIEDLVNNVLEKS